jgi:5-guanidino-2-oxopentanoate decarboxylase
MNETISCGSRLMQILKAYGVDTVFGMPGVHTLEAYRGMDAAGIRHIGVRHEQGAGFMADGYARMSGKPGVCVLISGPGVTNAATPIGQAYSDSVPMLVITSVAANKDLGMGRGTLHEITDQSAVTRPLTAFSETATSPEQVREYIARAFALFESGRPRPVHLSIPLDVFKAPDDRLASRRTTARRRAPDWRAGRSRRRHSQFGQTPGHPCRRRRSLGRRRGEGARGKDRRGRGADHRRQGHPARRPPARPGGDGRPPRDPGFRARR